ncbi:AAA family ATPase [Neolewinella antarctica]|uniref:ATP-binding protein involved in virulence n=1 Tax=Neolewinella antarctica TaxID=442734 RepID=A0ABX0X9S8_9BACT|nr:AAA family ATPase [Neolewinella antarctica]NJC25679.1 putative ATP-binding protein involved in virulence [Neolewinella antarctica]
MTIKSLTIENLRGFAGKHVVEFTDPHVAAFIGVNGSGKSTVLEAVAATLAGLVPFSLEGEQSDLINFNRFDVNNDHDVGGWVTHIVFEDTRDEYRFSHQIVNRAGTVDSLMRAFSTHEQNLVDQLSRDVVKRTASVPILAHYHAGATKYVDNGNSKTYPKITDKTHTYLGAFNGRVDFDKITAYYVHIINLQNSEIVKSPFAEYRSPYVSAFETVIEQFLRILSGDDFFNQVKLETVGIEQFLVYKKQGGTIQFNQLSAGEKVVLGLVMDLVFRCLAGNGHLDEPTSSSGIVVIDEIELHLHPRWQANIVEALRNTFPNIQFIISTHAPLVINQLQDNQLFLLTKNRIIPGSQLQEPYGMEAGDVISSLMGVPTRPEDVRKDFDAIRRHLNDPTAENLAAAQLKLEALAEKISPNDPEIIQLQTLITFETSEANY